MLSLTRWEKAVDLNQAYFDHQISLIRADEAETPCLEQAHLREAGSIAGRIGARQSKLGAAAACAWMRHATVQPA